MGKNNKKKRGRTTQRLYEAAARKLRKVGNDDDEDGANKLAPVFEKVVATSSSSVSLLMASKSIKEEKEDVISDESLDQVVQTLMTLTKTSQRLDQVRYSKRYKDLRRALHPLVIQQIKAYSSNGGIMDYRIQVSVHLSQQEYDGPELLNALMACLELNQIPKQGTIQRWVRDVNSCPNETQKIQLLSLILKLGGGSQQQQKDGTEASDDGEDGSTTSSPTFIVDGLNKHDPMRSIMALKLQAQKEAEEETQKEELGSDADAITILETWNIPDETISPNHPEMEMVEEAKLSFVSKIIYQEKGSERTPPNHFDLLLHYAIPTPTQDFIFPFDKHDRGSTTTTTCRRHAVPFVKGGFVLQNVLSPRECHCLKMVATKLGYRPDHPIALENSTGIDSCEWMIHETIHATIMDRVRDLLPKDSNAILLQSGNNNTTTTKDNVSSSNNNKNLQRGNKNLFLLHSINRRWRFFRYGQDCVYRPHIDGSWPESRLSSSSSSPQLDECEYETDTSGDTKSFLTFLIYLNDDFEGGSTRFFHANSSSSKGINGNGAGMLVAQGVQPKMGCVLVFPQGNTASLLHEGSAVTKGTKYVIRTDVLYRRHNAGHTD